MRRVRSHDTAAEIVVRKTLYSLGFRYRLHRRELPGKPDIALLGRKRVIFIHGCFWHGHDCKRGNRLPKTNSAYWLVKIERNRARDRQNQLELNEAGWLTLVLWECELRDLDALAQNLIQFLSD
jgi:DNA mismatch endonuclease (patch repair protein)